MNGSATLAMGVFSGKRPIKSIYKMPQKWDSLYHFYLYHFVCHPLNLIVAPGLCKKYYAIAEKYGKKCHFHLLSFRADAAKSTTPF